MRIRVLAVLSVLFLALGVAPAASAASAPGKPGAVSAVSGKGSYVVTWKAPAKGAKVTGYQVADRQRKAKKWSAWKVRTVKKRTAVVKGKNGSTHQVRVRAKSKKGLGAWSRKVTVVIGLPSAPRGASASQGDKKLAVAWSAAKANGSAIKSYRVQTRYRTGSKFSGWSTHKAAGTATSVTVKGLSNSRTYQARVIAVNKRGSGPASAIASSVRPSVSVVAGGPYAGGENVTVRFAGFPRSETTLNVAVCANDGRPLSGPADCAPLGGASNKLVTPKNGAGSVALTVPKGALGNEKAPALVCGPTKNCAILVTTITSNFFMAGPVALAYADPRMSVSPTGPVQGGKPVTVAFSGFPASETTLNVAVCANDGRMLSGPGDCAPLGGDSNKLVTPKNGAGTVTLTAPAGALGNTSGAPITCDKTQKCAVVVTTITSNFFMAGPVALKYPDPVATMTAGPYAAGQSVTVDFSGFPVSETTLNVAVCANDGRMLTGPNDCAPFGDSNKLVTPANGAGSVTLTLPAELGNTAGVPLTCGGSSACAVVVTTITSNFFMAGPLAFTYPV